MHPRVVYVSCADPPVIHRFTMDAATGALDAVDVVPVTHPDAADFLSSPMALTPDQTRLYFAVRKPPYPCSAFAVDSSGGLRFLGTGALADQLCYISTDRTGRYLLCASYQGAMVAVHALDAEGIVQSPAQQVIKTPLASHSILADPSNRFVFAANLSSNTILRFTFDAATGRLTPLESTPVPGNPGPRHIRFSPNQRFLYVINETAGSVHAYGFNAGNGDLTFCHEVSILPDGAKADESVFAADLQITPDGRFAYGSVRTTNTIMALRLDPVTGAMSRIGWVPSEDSPRALAVDPSGRFLYDAGQKSNTIGIYAIHPDTGALTRTGSAATGGNPNWFTFLL